MNWIIDFLTEYVNTPNYLHTMSDNAIFYTIIGVFAVIVGLTGYVAYKVIRWIIKELE